ncbi:MAG: phosphotransferase [Chloroflexia bacterium]|nr:phosphotransferase [Chloroflexia bacterium]
MGSSARTNAVVTGEPMRDDPGLDFGAISSTLRDHYGLGTVSATFQPVGHDPNASVFEVMADDGRAYFLKVRSGPVHEPGLLVTTTLTALGIPNVLAPIQTATGDLWCPLAGVNGRTVVLYPFIRGQNAASTGLTDDQWRTFGLTLRTIHDLGTSDPGVRAGLGHETFALPSAALVRRLSRVIAESRFDDGIAERFAGWWRSETDRIERLLARAGTLGQALRSRSLDAVLCHADIHAANLLIADGGAIWLVDWDGPTIAPRERDLLFVVGSRIAREVLPREEDLFFEGYGPIQIDPAALAYFRYERIVEDLGEFGKSVLLSSHLSDETRAGEAALAASFFGPDGDVDRAEIVPRRRWPPVEPAA